MAGVMDKAGGDAPNQWDTDCAVTVSEGTVNRRAPMPMTIIVEEV